MMERLKEVLSQRQKGPQRGTAAGAAPPVPAAVLIPLFKREEEYHLLFTRRTQEVEHHKGQISFPGGARHPEDGSLKTTALRESWEEIALHPDVVEVLGELDDLVTGTNFLVTPFVATIPYPYPLQPNPVEVEEIIEVPLAALLDERNLREEPGPGGEPAYFYDYGGRVIWGATARILKQFLDLFRDA